MISGTRTSDIRKAVAARFSGEEWACFFEVASGTGGNAGRSADALAMNMYPSRGLRVHGVEIKASRGDWLRELKTPAKSEPIQRYCDHWWIATLPGIVAEGELPPTWGLLELHGKSLRQKVAAPLLNALPMERAFIASLLRSAARRASVELRDAVEKRTEEARTKMADDIERAVNSRTDSHRRLQQAVDDFEKASGISIRDQWFSTAQLGEAVKLIKDLGITTIHGRLGQVARNARAFADQVDLALPQLLSTGEEE